MLLELTALYALPIGIPALILCSVLLLLLLLLGADVGTGRDWLVERTFDDFTGLRDAAVKVQPHLAPAVSQFPRRVLLGIRRAAVLEPRREQLERFLCFLLRASCTLHAGMLSNLKLRLLLLLQLPLVLLPRVPLLLLLCCCCCCCYYCY